MSARRLMILACLSIGACASQTPTTSVPESLLAAIRADAAKSSGVPAAQIEIVSSEKLDWSDGALGCPQPGRMYTQALVPGYRIWVRAGKTLLDYHATESGAFAVCAK